MATPATAAAARLLPIGIASAVVLAASVAAGVTLWVVGKRRAAKASKAARVLPALDLAWQGEGATFRARWRF